MILRAASLGLLGLLVPGALSSCSGASASCDDRRSEAASIVQAVLSSPSSRQCATDTDCAVESASTPCSFSCGGVPIANAGVAALSDAVAQASALCDTDCVEPVPPCAEANQFALCANGACITSTVPPAGWVSLSIQQGGGTSAPAMCTAGASCALWTLTPDAALVVTKSGVTHQATLSPADLQTVNGIVQSLAFRENVAGNPPWTCGMAPLAPIVSLDVTYTTATIGADVTGCVDGGPPGNDPQLIFQVLSAY